MTVLEKCLYEADVNKVCAKKSPTKTIKDHFLADAELWKARARRLTPEQAAKNVNEVNWDEMFKPLPKRPVLITTNEEEED